MFTRIVRRIRRSISPSPGSLQPRDQPRELAQPQALSQQRELSLLRELSSQGRWKELEGGVRELLASPGSLEVVDALELMAYALQQQGRLQEASALADGLARVLPGRWMLHFIAGVSFKGIGQFDAASGHLRQAMHISPADRQTLRQFLEAVAAAQGVDQAAAECRAHFRDAGVQREVVVARVRGLRDWARDAGVPLIDAGDIEDIPFVAPHVWGEPANDERGSAQSNAPCVAELADARIFSGSSIILTGDGTALSDTGGHPRFGVFVNFAYEPIVLAQEPGKLLLSVDEFPTRELAEGMMLSGLASSAFGHWLPEFLPKLQFLRAHPDFARLPLIVDAGMPPAHFEHLQRLCSNEVVKLAPGESLRCNRLLVAPPPTFLPVETFPHDVPMRDLPGLSLRALRFLQGSDAPDGSGPGQRRIFLARRKLQWRRVANEEEIAKALVSLGFEIVYLEELGVAQQIELFRSAGWIVGANGSALLNLIFADTRVKLLVLSQPDLYNWGTFQGPMEGLGYHPLWVVGELAASVNSKHADYTVPLDRVLGALRALGLPELAAQEPTQAAPP